METITLTDVLYGAVTIDEPVLIELITSGPIQRLKGVNQHGPMAWVQPTRGQISRYDHSVGVMLLLRRYHASLKEQIAGLLHDVSHTAFSHVIDYVWSRDREQDIHEQLQEQVIRRSTIPEILARHGYDLADILAIEQFPLLEQDKPELCADRIDYGLRDSVVTWKFLTAEQAQAHLQHLQAVNNQWVFDSAAAARAFALDFMHIVRDGHYEPLNAGAFDVLSRAIRLALDRNLIDADDFMQTDEIFYKKLRAIDQPDIIQLLDQLENLHATYDETEYSSRRFPKIRYVDPLFLDSGKLIRLSSVDAEYQTKMNAHIDWIRNGLPLRYV
jgi:HD superfamily phosphohydrolase